MKLSELTKSELAFIKTKADSLKNDKLVLEAITKIYSRYLTLKRLLSNTKVKETRVISKALTQADAQLERYKLKALHVKESDFIVTNTDELKKKRRKGIAWIETMMKQYISDSKISLLQPISKPQIGSLYMYVYDAKYKNELPYWDALPLVIPISINADHMIGLNLHYLPVPLRVKLFTKLLEFMQKTTNKQYLNITYKLLTSISEHKLVSPTIHKYLLTNIKTRLIKIPAEIWSDVVYLPLQQFQKASAESVWADTKKRIKR